jgi:uncharacterized protein (DUF488 family)
MIYTVGHSIHPIEVFLQLLEDHGIAKLADVRAIPASRRHPQFGRDRLAESLATRGIAYRHFPALGGRRRPLSDSINTSWREDAFRGYADYMQTDAFDRALDELLAYAEDGKTVTMCAEAMWWQCHRRLLSDALLVRGVPVLHIVPRTEAKAHELTDFARPRGGKVIYPGLL